MLIIKDLSLSPSAEMTEISHRQSPISHWPRLLKTLKIPDTHYPMMD